MNSDPEFQKTIDLIVKILKKYPFSRPKILKLILQKMPHTSFPLFAHSVSISILFSLVQKLPLLETEILEFIIGKIIAFDAEIHIPKFNFNLKMKDNVELVI